MASRVKSREVYDGEWQLVTHDPDTGVSKWIMPDPDGPVSEYGIPLRWITRTTTPTSSTAALIERNKRLYAESEGKRWGDGQIAYSMPQDEYFRSGVADAKKQGDTGWLRRFFNDPDHRAFRTFKGRL